MAAAAAVTLAAGCAPKAETPDIIPFPNSLEMHGGTFNAAGTTFYCTGIDDPLTLAAVEKFAGELSQACGMTSKVETGSAGKGINFSNDASMPEEAYRIDVKKNGVTVKASSLNGFIYALQTLRQMLPVEIYGHKTAADRDWSLPCLSINDAPRFAYRGMHLDVSRHFFDKDFVKKYIDLLALHNMNFFHWHLTDDQGWRIEIRKYPLLAEKSCRRDYTVIRRDYDRNDGTPYGEGCYFTQEDIREIVQYALDRHIRIIPEIDMPGHMLAALAAYPQFGCTGGPYKVWTRWGVSDQVLCAGKDETVQFAKDVLSEVADLFPCRYIHIGGDECPKTEWKECPDCQARIVSEGIQQGSAESVEDALQGWFMKEMTDFLKTKGKTVIGWDELLESGAAGDDMTVMSWRGTEGGIAAAEHRMDAIMVPHSYLYFDYYQTDDRSQEPFAAGGKVTVEKVFNYDPYDGIPEKDRKYIIGVQANLWTEFIAEPSHAEYMVIPRIDALSEVQWSPLESRQYADFLKRLRRQLNLYDMLGYNYARYVFE